MIRQDVIKDKNAKIWIIDFSVANYYPSIQEFAVLTCDILFDVNATVHKTIPLALKEYQKRINLTQQELSVLPAYVRIAHAMHVLCATYEKKVRKNKTPENEYFLKIGRAGLRQKMS